MSMYVGMSLKVYGTQCGVRNVDLIWFGENFGHGDFYVRHKNEIFLVEVGK